MDEKGGKRSKRNRQENGENRRIIFIFVPASAFDMFRLRLNQKDMQQNNWACALFTMTTDDSHWTSRIATTKEKRVHAKLQKLQCGKSYEICSPTTRPTLKKDVK